MNSCNHDRLRTDIEFRQANAYRFKEQHLDEIQSHILYFNCNCCHSTLAVPLEGNVDEEAE